VEPGKRTKILYESEFTAQTIYYRVESKSNKIWEGNYYFLAHPDDNFDLKRKSDYRLTNSDSNKGNKLLGFAKVDTGDNTNFTLNVVPKRR